MMRLIKMGPLCVGLLAAAESWAAGRLQFDPPVLNLGRIGQHQTIHRTINATNVGDEAIEIRGTRSDCSCATAIPVVTQIAPGERISVRFIAESRAYLGPVSREVVLETSAGDFGVTMDFDVAPLGEWDIASYPVVFPATTMGLPASVQLILSRSAGSVARLSDAASDVPWLAVVLGAGQANESSKELRLTKLASAPAGSRTATVTVRTSDPKQPRLSIPVVVPVLDQPRAFPELVVLPPTRVGERASGELRITGWLGKEPPVASFPGGDVEPPRLENGSYVFVVTARPASLGRAHANLKVTARGMKALTIPVEINGAP